MTASAPPRSLSAIAPAWKADRRSKVLDVKRILPAGLGLLIALAGCQPASLVVAQQPQMPDITEAAAPGVQDAVIAAVPPCLDSRTATLAGGLVIRYRGADPTDPEVCLTSWRGKTHRYLAGFWGGGRFRKGTTAERDAIKRALTGPVGTKTSFEDTRADLWGKVTVEHVARPALPLRNSLRRTVQLRIVRHDARGRPDVQREALHWIDVKTGIALKRQTVTRLSSGEQQVFTTWRVQQLTDGSS